MSASNYNWVCFRCHFSMRQAKTSSRVPKCRECGGDCHCLGYKVKVPQKDDAVSWKRLKTSCREIEAEERQRRAVDRAKRKHWLEQEIIRFEAMDENRDRRRLVESLREELSALP